MKVLELDAGNTRLKWRMLQDGQAVQRGVLVNGENWQTALSLLLTEVGRIDEARASVVSGADRSKQLSSVIRTQAGIELNVIKNRPEWRGLTLDYENPLKLGIDRWLAMLAAWDCPTRGARIVVDAGTALTIDLVDTHGQHLGGYIVPGQALMKKALLTNTAHLGISHDPVKSIDPGNKTMDCINQGVLAMSVALINKQTERFNDGTVYLTGGDAPQLQPHIKAECLYRPELVMDGLALAVREN